MASPLTTTAVVTEGRQTDHCRLCDARQPCNAELVRPWQGKNYNRRFIAWWFACLLAGKPTFIPNIKTGCLKYIALNLLSIYCPPQFFGDRPWKIGIYMCLMNLCKYFDECAIFLPNTFFFEGGISGSSDLGSKISAEMKRKDTRHRLFRD